MKTQSVSGPRRRLCELGVRVGLAIALVATSVIAEAAAARPAGAADGVAGLAVVPNGSGAYWTVTSAGEVVAKSGAMWFGSMVGRHLNRPIVGMTSTPSGRGYWLVASDGGIFSFGDAVFHGSTGAMRLNKPIVGMAATPSGYWLVASDGGIFSFGDARFFGSTGALSLNRPIVGMGATPSAAGYWLVASDGGVFAFGDASFYGSTGSLPLNKPIEGIASSPSARGYWLIASDGGVFAFGDAPFLGSSLSAVRTFGIVPDGSGGYRALREDGTVVHQAAAASVGQPQGPWGSWNRVFNDEFNGSALDTSRWLTCYPWAPDGCSIGYDEAEWYLPDNVTVSNGALNLTARKETVTGWGQTWQYTSGMVNSGPDLQRGLPPKFAFTYGYVEARVWVPRGKALWPALWLLPAERQWPPELDVFEVLGQDPTTVYMTNHWGTEQNHLQSSEHYTGEDLSAGWHTIGLNWQPDSLTWYVDGVQRRTTFTDASVIPDKPMYVIMNLAVGGTWPGYPDSSTPFPSTYKVDWLRVWQR